MTKITTQLINIITKLCIAGETYSRTGREECFGLLLCALHSGLPQPNSGLLSFSNICGLN